MALTWSGRRQVMYTGVALVIAAVVLYFGWQALFYTPVSCLNNVKDGTEVEVDCGGSCSLICADQSRSPVVLWARSFETSPSTYSAVAYLQNNNVGAAARRVAYTFQLFDDKNLLVYERQGVTDLPPIQIIPVVETNINIGNRTVARTLFAFTSLSPAVWHKVPDGAYPALSVGQQSHNSDYSRLEATISNNTLSDAKGVAVVAVLFDSSGVARATTKSLIGTLSGKSQQQVVFTWPSGFSDIVRSEITVLPAF